jgi:hypothetical protein
MSDEPMKTEKVHTITESARLIGVERQTIHSWIKKAVANKEDSKDPLSILYYLRKAISQNGKKTYLIREDFIIRESAKRQAMSKELAEEAYVVYYELYAMIEQTIGEEEDKSSPSNLCGNMAYIDSEISSFIYQYIKASGELNEKSPLYNIQLDKIRNAISQLRFTNKELAELSIRAMNNFREILLKDKENNV